MEVIAIGKPAINVYLPLQEFPTEGDLFTITTKNESVGNVAATSACLLAKWGISTHFSGVVGNDSYAEKVRETFKNNRVNVRYIETNFTSGTCANYITLNVKTGVTTKVLYNDLNVQLTKYKYDFIPNFGIIDGTDFAGALALINNNGSTCKTLFYARRGDKDTISLAKKCTYVVCTENFAESLTHETADGSAESYVNMYQKIVDASGKSNYIVILNNHKILYAVDGAVKMLPEMKINIADQSSFDSVFVGALAYALIKEVLIDDAIKFANTAAAISLTKIGEEASIPSLDDVLNNSGLKEKFGVVETTSNRVAQAQEVTPLMSNNNITSQNNGNMNSSAITQAQEEQNMTILNPNENANGTISNQNVTFQNTNDHVVSNQNAMDSNISAFNVAEFQNNMQYQVSQPVAQQTSMQQNGPQIQVQPTVSQVQTPMGQPIEQQPVTNIFDNNNE